MHLPEFILTFAKINYMNLVLNRKYKLPKYSIGKLYINGKYFCDTLEDTDRGLTAGMSLATINSLKKKGITAIPLGTYEITLNVYSPKFGARSQYAFCKGYLPRLLKVPGYEGVLIHIGNRPEDTEGCILVGENTIKGMVTSSTDTFKRLYKELETATAKGEQIILTII